MRTFDEINAEVNIAISKDDAPTLMRLAGELDELTTTKATAVAHSARGWACYCTSDYPAALEHYNSALALHHELGNRSGMASVTVNIGTVFASTGDYPAAVEHYNRALALHHELGNRSGVANVNCNIGNVYYVTGNYPAALERLISALALYHELGDRNGVATVTGNIGNVYSYTGDYPAALEHYNSYLALCHLLDDRRGAALATGNIGNVYSGIGDYPAALDHYNSALALHLELGERSNAARVTSNVLHTLLSSDDVDGARQTLAALDDLHTDDPSIAVHRETGRAKLQVLDGDFQAAQTTLANALDLATAHGIRAHQSDVCKELRDLAQKRNDFADYIEHSNEFTRINEEIRGKESIIKLAMQAREREIVEKDKETAKHIAVLHSTLPKHIADRVARGEVVNDHYDNAAVLFLDIVGFTSISDRIPAGHVVHLLDQIFSALDILCDKHDVTKIKTIGDSYMAVGFEGNTTERMAACALDMLSTLNDMEIKMPAELGDTSWTNDVGDIRVRIGLHVGPVTAGVIGTQRMQYDVWGDTVNVASRMEGTSEAGRIHVSEAFAINLGITTEYRIQNSMIESENAESLDASLVTSHFTHFSLQLRGSVDVKGKGPMTTYWLEQA